VFPESVGWSFPLEGERCEWHGGKDGRLWLIANDAELTSRFSSNQEPKLGGRVELPEGEVLRQERRLSNNEKRNMEPQDSSVVYTWQLRAPCPCAVQADCIECSQAIRRRRELKRQQLIHSAECSHFSRFAIPRVVLQRPPLVPELSSQRKRRCRRCPGGRRCSSLQGTQRSGSLPLSSCLKGTLCGRTRHREKQRVCRVAACPMTREHCRHWQFAPVHMTCEPDREAVLSTTEKGCTTPRLCGRNGELC